MADKVYDLEDRFVEFAARVIDVADLLRRYYMEKLKVLNQEMISYIK